MNRKQPVMGSACRLLLLVSGTIVAFCQTSAGTDKAITGPVNSGTPSNNKTVESKLVKLAMSVSIKRADGVANFIQGEPVNIQVQLMNENAETDYLCYREKAKAELEAGKLGVKTGEVKEYVLSSNSTVKLPKQAYGWAGTVKFQVIKKTNDGKSDMEMWQQKNWSTCLVSDRKQVESELEIAERPVCAIWTLGPELTRDLAQGRYEVVVHYDTSALDSTQVTRGDLVGRCEFYIVKTTAESNDVRFFNEQARVYLKVGNPDEAIRYAKMGIAKDPSFDRYQAYLCLAEAYESKGMLREAISAYEEFLKHNTNTQRWNYPNLVKQRVERLKQKVEKEKQEEAGRIGTLGATGVTR